MYILQLLYKSEGLCLFPAVHDDNVKLILDYLPTMVFLVRGAAWLHQQTCFSHYIPLVASKTIALKTTDI